MKKCILIISIFLFLSCQDGRWYPTADVELETYSEFIDPLGVKQVLVSFTIKNTSKTSIFLSTITFKVETDKREYYQTLSSTVKIIPNGTIALTAVLSYIDNTEEYINTVIINSFFD